jgi:hypothetical protein
MDLKGENNMFKKNGIELGKVLERDNIPYVKGTDKRVSWQTDEYLAAIIRDYIRMVEKYEWHIGNAILDNGCNPIYGKTVDEGKEEDKELVKKWHDLLLDTANMFDEYLIKKKKLDEKFNFDFKALLDNAFENMKKIFMDLWV